MSTCDFGTASITVTQDGITSFASALLNAQEYEIFVDDQRIGVLNGYTSRKTCSVSPGPHSIYVRAYARSSASLLRIYGYSQSIQVNLYPGESKCFSCGIGKGSSLRKALIFAGVLVSILLLAGIGPVSELSRHARYQYTAMAALVTVACSWIGHSSVPGANIYLREQGGTLLRQAA
jgi:hypothetical protein